MNKKTRRNLRQHAYDWDDYYRDAQNDVEKLYDEPYIIEKPGNIDYNATYNVLPNALGGAISLNDYDSQQPTMSIDIEQNYWDFSNNFVLKGIIVNT
jgi:hypothetical protein